MLSWAVTRGPSLVPGDKRLAIHVEDHPIEYNKFEGTIPKGEYGGGTVMIWDRGTWTPEHDPHKGMKKGHLDFELHGEKLKGHWHLVRMRKRPGERQEPWLLIKATDEFAAQEIRSGYPGRDAEFRGHRPDHGRDRRRTRSGSGIPTEAPRTSQGGQSRAQSQSQPLAAAAPKPRADARRKRRSKKSPARVQARAAGTLPDFIPPCLATLSSHGAGQRATGCTRSSSTATASRRGSATARSR